MRQRTSAEAKRIEAEYQARREAAIREAQERQEIREEKVLRSDP